MSSCLTSRGRDAPSAVRTAISPLRAVARASSRLATLPQAMSRTSPTAPKSTMSVPPTSPTTTWRYGTSRSLHVSFSGYICSSCRAMPSISRARDGDAGRQAAETAQEVEAAHRRLAHAEWDRPPHLHVDHAVEERRQDADDGVRASVDGDAGAEDAGVLPEALLPKSVRQMTTS